MGEVYIFLLRKNVCSAFVCFAETVEPANSICVVAIGAMHFWCV